MKFKESLLTDISNPKQWKTISTSDLKESGYPVYGANGKIGFYNSYTHKEETLLITCRGATCGTINICEPFSYVNGNAMAVDDLDTGKISLKFLYYYLQKRGFNDVISGSAQPQITRQGLQNIKIPLPPLETQKQIAAVLNKANELRQKRKQSNVKLDELLQSTFLDMFGDPVANPKNWIECSIKNICEVQTGSTPSREKPEYYSGNIPWIKTGEVVNGYIYDTEEHITQEAVNKSNCKLFPQNTILVAMYGQGFTRGRIAVLRNSATTNQACSAILPSNKINHEFLFNLLKVQYNTLRELGRGGNQPNLNLSMIKDFKIYLPPLDLQNKFAQIVEKVEQQKAKNEASAQKLDDLFNVLLQRAFKGELEFKAMAKLSC
jgi:type I restriction enzyme, S subunit